MIHKKGFTLIELLVVIVIVGLLAAVVIPRFTGYRNKAKASEFPTVLALISIAQRAHFVESEAHKHCPTQTLLKDSLGVNMTQARYFTYTSTSLDTANQFVALAELIDDLGEVPAGHAAGINGYGIKGAPHVLKNLQRAYFSENDLTRTPTEDDQNHGIGNTGNTENHGSGYGNTGNHGSGYRNRNENHR